MIQKKHQKIISILTSIIIAGSLLTGCSSSQPVHKNITVIAKQQSQQKIDEEKKAKEEAVVNAKKETDLKAQLVAAEEAKVNAEKKAKIESDARIVAEQKSKQETEARVQAEAQLKSDQEEAQLKADQKAAQSETVEVSQNQSISVYVTKTGKKYHRDGCRYLSKSKIPISLENAESSYSPCSVCNPPQ